MAQTIGIASTFDVKYACRTYCRPFCLITNMRRPSEGSDLSRFIHSCGSGKRSVVTVVQVNFAAIVIEIFIINVAATWARTRHCHVYYVTGCVSDPLSRLNYKNVRVTDNRYCVWYCASHVIPESIVSRSTALYVRTSERYEEANYDINTSSYIQIICAETELVPKKIK